MRIAHLSLGLIALLSPLSAAWSKEDREIFRIRDEINAHEANASSTFYEILGILPSASQDDITKAYRQKARTLHPDKVAQKLKADRAKATKDKKTIKPPTKAEVASAVKLASERQARLSLIVNILRGSGRERYDHFLAHGFPLWKGTDYYYNRYRPGLGTAIMGVILLCGGAVHYLVLFMSWKRQREFLDRYIKFARDTAWGSNAPIPGVEAASTSARSGGQDDDEGPPQPMNRRQRRMQEKGTKREDGRGPVKKARRVKAAPTPADDAAAPSGPRKRVVAENGKILVVDSLGDVYLEEQDKEGVVHEYLLDTDELLKPTIKDTALVRVPIWAFRSTIGRFLFKPEQDIPEIIVDDEDSDAPQRTPSSDSAGDDDYEILEKSTDSFSKAGKASGSSKSSKKKSKKR